MDVFFACFADLEDPRDDNARHDLLELLVIALCAVLCGAEDCSDMALFGRAKEAFFREFLTLRHGVPSHDTFSRVFRLIDPVKFHACFLVFMRKFSETIQGVIAIDGKTLRRSFDRASKKSALHLVSAWAADQGRNRKDHSPENLALLRRLALNLAKLEPSKGSMKAKLKQAGWDNAFLAKLLAQFAHPQMR